MTIFANKILALVRQIPRGKVTTYKILALKIGSASLARPVGNALHKNPYLIKIPCHRVVKSSGEIGNYQLGLAKKRKMLQNEGIKIKAGKIENFTDILYNFN